MNYSFIQCLIIVQEMKHKSQNEIDMIKTENLVNGADYMQSKKIAETLKKRREANLPFTYAGDLLIAVNPEDIDLEEKMIKLEYNEPHIVAVTENVYNKMIHEKKDQLILTYGYSNQGIHNLYQAALKTLCNLGSAERFETTQAKSKVLAGDFILTTLTSRSGGKGSSVFRQNKVCFNASGSLSGVKFQCYFQEGYSNFKNTYNEIKIFKAVLIGLRMQGKIREFGLHHFIDSEEEPENVTKQAMEEYTGFVKALQTVGFRSETGINVILRVLVAIQLIFKLEFEKDIDVYEVVNRDVLESVSDLLELDNDFLLRALTQTNVMTQGKFFHCQEPEKNVASLACVLYSRLIDWVEEFINSNLQLSLTVYGFKFSVCLLEFPGIMENGENSDDFGNLMANTTTEIIHWIVQKMVIKWEEIEARNNRLKLRYPTVQDNKGTLDGLLSFTGFIPILNECAAKKSSFDPDLSKQYLKERFFSSPDCFLEGDNLKVNHFWSQVMYNTSQMLERNENFINPEIIQTMSSSSDECLRNIFQLPLNEYGKVQFRETIENQGYSQTLAQQSIMSRFRHWIMDLIQTIIHTSTHIVFSFDNTSSLCEQVEAFNIKEISYVRKKGYPHRLTFSEFLRRYCFLGFNFDERVVATRDNAQLLMLRLAIDGFECGKRKIFLKYYHINYLSEMYNKQFKRIVIIQSAARRFLAKKRAQKEKTARLAKTMINVRRIIKKWKTFKSVHNQTMKHVPRKDSF